MDRIDWGPHIKQTSSGKRPLVGDVISATTRNSGQVERVSTHPTNTRHSFLPFLLFPLPHFPFHFTFGIIYLGFPSHSSIYVPQTK